jgi:aerobic carbon-monoxide dehydrogenase large subunit
VHVGTAQARVEDRRLLQGTGRFVDDVDLPGMCALRVVRSPVASGRIRGLQTDRAAQLPGVRLLVTGEDLADVACIPMRLQLTSDDLTEVLQPVLARERVRYVGEPLAIVVAEDPYTAEDAADAIVADIEPLPAVLDADTAGDAAAPRLWDDRSNVVATLDVAYGDVGHAFADADEIVELEVRIARQSGVPLETRGVLAAPGGTGGLTIWGFTKVPHFNRRVLARLLGVPSSAIVLRSCDAGGGFGIRGEFYPEDFLVPYAALRLGRPVKWIEDRQEHMVAANHSRDQVHRIAGAFATDGTLLGLRDEIVHDTGAYLRTHGVTVPQLTVTMLPGPYRLPAYEGRVHVVTTNKTPAGTYRAPGRYEGTLARERLLDLAAQRLGVDPVELRRINLLGPSELPLERQMSALGTQVRLDAGDYPGLLERALSEADYAAWQAETHALRRRGRTVGTGLAFFLEKSGLGPYETAEVHVDDTGAVQVRTGGASLGQGIETVLAQIAADELGVDPAAVRVVHGDSDLVPDGVGSWASRSTVVGGSAVKLAGERTAALARRVGAEVLGVSEDKVELRGGRVQVRRAPDNAVTLGEVAAACDPLSAVRRGDAPGLSGAAVFTVDHMTYPYGVHLAQVEIDDTGGVSVRRYFVAYEVGRAINPQLVHGQIVGGFAQGLGGALLESFAYGEGGQPLATQLIDYLLPTAAEIPRIGVLVAEDAPSVDNPLGAKGAGEGGITGAGAALAAAVADALGPADAVTALPMTPEHISTVRRMAQDQRRQRRHEGAST